MAYVNLDATRIKAKYRTNKLGLFAAKEFKRLCDPFTPQREKNLVRNVRYEPWQTEYLEPYAHYIYVGELYVDPQYKKGGFTDGNVFWSRKGVEKVPSGRDLVFRKNMAIYASKEWDKAAIKAGRGKTLATSIQKQIDKGDF